MNKKVSRRKTSPQWQSLPVYCDFSCAHASIASPDAVGACRREQAVYCTVLDTYNVKNSLCLVRKQAGMRKWRAGAHGAPYR